MVQALKEKGGRGHLGLDASKVEIQAAIRLANGKLRRAASLMTEANDLILDAWLVAGRLSENEDAA